tara:strand:- start:534 stop:710 length:177 start_codon:yes stop_codon:yes gene_type:complete
MTSSHSIQEFNMDVSIFTVARRLIPWFIVTTILLPLTFLLILIGFGKADAAEFWEAVT